MAKIINTSLLILLLSSSACFAATARLDPNGETCIGAACAGGWNIPIYSKMNQPTVTNPSTPDTSNPAHLVPADGDDYRIKIDLTTQSSVSSATSITINYYTRGFTTDILPSLYASGVEVGSPTSTIPSTSYGWITVTWSGLSLNQTQVDSLQVLMDTGLSDPPSGSQYIDIAEMYVDMTYTASSSPNNGSAILF